MCVTSKRYLFNQEYIILKRGQADSQFEAQKKINVGLVSLWGFNRLSFHKGVEPFGPSEEQAFLNIKVCGCDASAFFETVLDVRLLM